ncbi:MAG: hypothetical protein GXP63_07175 [DPANN group archaeon]|nr:hypothetical protein [DPANN group archaeon]
MSESGGEEAPSGESAEGIEGTLEEAEGHPKDIDQGVLTIILNEETGEMVMDDRPGLYAVAETVQEGEAYKETMERGLHEELAPEDSVDALLALEPENIGRYTHHIEGTDREGTTTIYLLRINPKEHSNHAAIWEKATTLYARTGTEGADAGKIMIESLDELARLPKERFAYNFKFFVDALTRMQYSDRPYMLMKIGIKPDGNTAPKTMDFSYFRLN